MLSEDKKESFNAEKENGKDYSAIIGIILWFSPFVFLFFGKPLLGFLCWVAFMCFFFYHLIESTAEKKEKIGGWILFVIILLVFLYIAFTVPPFY